ncbi:MAG: D-aminoacyl-tRNA deacylase [Candidatus Izemoplasmatales bacterium]
MRIVVQRVKSASVQVLDKEVSSIQKGFLLLVGIHVNDTLEIAKYLAKKVAKLRIFTDQQDKLNLDICQVDGEILSVSQFTLYGDTSDGNRPSFTSAMRPEGANELYSYFNHELELLIGRPVKTGIFQTEMSVSLVNDGPVTIILEKS